MQKHPSLRNILRLQEQCSDAARALATARASTEEANAQAQQSAENATRATQMGREAAADAASESEARRTAERENFALREKAKVMRMEQQRLQDQLGVRRPHTRPRSLLIVPASEIRPHPCVPRRGCGARPSRAARGQPLRSARGACPLHQAGTLPLGPQIRHRRHPR